MLVLHQQPSSTTRTRPTTKFLQSRRGKDFAVSRLQFPTRPILATQKRVGLRGILAAHGYWIPLESLSYAVRNVAQVIRFSKPAGILKITSRRLSSLARVYPLRMVSNRVGNRLSWTLEPFKLFLGEEHMLTVIGQQHSFVSDKQNARLPLWDTAIFPDWRLVHTLVPGERDRR